MKCQVWTGKCRVRSVKYGVSPVECQVCSEVQGV